MQLLCRQEIDIETWAGPTFEASRVLADMANLPSVEKVLAALLPSSTCVPSTESMERTASKLRTANSRFEVNATRSYIALRLRCTHQWRTRQLSNSCLSWHLVRRPAVSYRFITEPDSQ